MLPADAAVAGAPLDLDVALTNQNEYPGHVTSAPPITAHLVAPAAAPAVLHQPVVAAVTPVLVTVAHHQHLEAVVLH